MDFASFKLSLDDIQELRERILACLAFAREHGQTYPHETDKCLEELSNHPESVDLIGAIALARGWIWFDTGDYPLAKGFFHRSLAVAEASPSTLDLIKALNGLASCLVVLGEPEHGLQYYERALILAEEIGNQDQQQILTTNIGIILSEQGHFDESLEYFRRNHELGWMDSFNRIINISQMSWALVGAGRYEEAEEYIEEVLSKTGINYMPAIYAGALVCRARIFIENNATGEAKETLLKIQEIPLAHSNPRNNSQVYYLRGRLAAALGEYREGRMFLDKAEAENLRTKNLSLDLDILKTRILIAKTQGNLQEALEFVEQLNEHQASFRTQQVRQEVARISSRQAQRETDLYRSLFRKIEAISQVGQLITSNLQLSDILDTISLQVATIMPSDAFGISLYNEKSHTLDYTLFMEQGVQLPGGRPPRPVADDSFSGWTVLNKTSILLGDALQEYQGYLSQAPPRFTGGGQQIARSVMYVPLLVQDRVLGVVTAQSYQANVYTDQDLEALKALGAYIAIAVENSKLYAKMLAIASTDTLTGAMSRHRLYDVARGELSRYKRFGTLFSIIIVDLDFFKHINDTFGHSAGDFALKEFAARCIAMKRDSDSFARYGGEEFLFILGDTDLEGAFQFAERVRRQIEKNPIDLIDGDVLSLTASFGVTQVKDTDESLDDALNRADTALYQAKGKGRNQVVAS